MITLKDIQDDQNGISRKRLKIDQDAAQQRFSNRRKECLQLFSGTSSGKDVTYERHKNRVDQRVEGNYTWVLEHDDFRTWLQQDAGLLLISADPGCGKSVLSKYLIDYVLPPTSVTCYFFFKDQDQHKICQALCAILHQLFTQKPSLIEYAMKSFDKEGRDLISSANLLWDIFQGSVQDPEAGSIIIILDALDEFSELEDLVTRIERQSGLSKTGCKRLKYLMTS